MTLFSDPGCPYCHRVRMVIAEKRINIEVVDVDAKSPSDELLESNPYGTVPTLIDRDLRLYESTIVMEYLDERFPHPPLLPVDPVGRANARLFIHRVERDWYERMRIIVLGDADAADQARAQLVESLASVAPIFAANRFFMSD
jgi:RNA polymerase-associated protein